MLYILNRSISAVTRNSKWLLLALVPVAVYAVVMAMQADRFTVSQDVAVDINAPVAVTANPVGTIPLKELTAVPEDFFQDRFALAALRDQATEALTQGEGVVSSMALRRLVSQTMSLQLTDDPRGVRIAYTGTGSHQGKELVDFYVRRLQERLNQGAARSERLGRGEAPNELFALPLQVLEKRSMWRAERTGPALLILVIAVAVVAAWLISREWADPTFKSERQAARYLDLPVLGSLPDINVLSRSLKA